MQRPRSTTDLFDTPPAALAARRLHWSSSMHKQSLVAPVVSLLAIVVAGPALAADCEFTVITGKMFADFSNIDLKNDGVESTANGTGIDVKRFYLGATHNFDDIWSVNVTTDFNYVANDSETQVFIKKAYLQAKLSDAFIGRVGSADLPWVPFVEDLCGCRYVENVRCRRIGT